MLRVPAENIIQLPLGIPGFDQARSFVLLDHRPGSIFHWLQSVDLPELAFVVIDPLGVDADYPVDNVHRGLTFLRLDPTEEVMLLVICTVPAAPSEPTANMLAPIGIGVQSRRGAQVVLHDTKYKARQPFLQATKAEK